MGETVETVTDFIFLGSKITADGDCSHEIKRRFLLGRKIVTNLDSEAQSCLTLCDPMNYTVHGILQARILEWVTFPFSRGSSQPRDQTQVSHIAGGFFTSWVTREAHKPRQHIKKQRHYLANKGLSSQSFGFSSSDVWMWELDHKESWAPQNCFWTVVLEKTLESSWTTNETSQP